MKLKDIILRIMMFVCLILLMDKWTVSTTHALQYDGFEYELIADGTEIKITGYNGDDTVLVVPSTINELPVTIVGEAAFKNCKDIETAIISDGILTIEKFAFSNCSNLKFVECVGQLEEIQDYAFEDCTNLKQIIVWKDVTQISEEAFYNCNEELVGFVSGYELSTSFGKMLYNSDIISIESIWADGMMFINGNRTTRVGKKLQLLCQHMTSSKMVANVRWTIEDETIATVDEYGVVTPRGVGSTKIYAEDWCGTKAEIVIDVLKPACSYGYQYIYDDVNSVIDYIKENGLTTSNGKDKYMMCLIGTSTVRFTYLEERQQLQFRIEIFTGVSEVPLKLEFSYDLATLEVIGGVNCECSYLNLDATATGIDSDTYSSKTELSYSGDLGACTEEELDEWISGMLDQISMALMLRIRDDSGLARMNVGNLGFVAHDTPFCEHKEYDVQVIPATLAKNGTINEICMRCANVCEKTINRQEEVELSKLFYAYDGKEKCPTVIVYDMNDQVIDPMFYTVTYKNNIKAGIATVVIEFKGNYSGTMEKEFMITECIHSWNQGVVTREATQYIPGVKTYTCTICADTKEEEIPVIKQDINNDQNFSENTDDTLTEDKGSTHVIDGASVVITSADENNRTVEYTCNENQNVKEITVPSYVWINNKLYKVTSIANGAFANNKYLSQIWMGYNIQSIGDNAFYNCKKLKSVYIGSNVMTIGKSAFQNCTSLTSITIPAKVSKIGTKAFYGCKKLKKMTIKTSKLTAKSVGKKAFGKAGSSNYKKLTVKVPKKKLKTYKSMLVKRGLSKKAKIKK